MAFTTGPIDEEEEEEEFQLILGYNSTDFKKVLKMVFLSSKMCVCW